MTSLIFLKVYSCHIEINSKTPLEPLASRLRGIHVLNNCDKNFINPLNQ